MNASLMISQLGTLAGVVLGSLLGARIQLRLLRHQSAEASTRETASACADFLAAERQFRRFLQADRDLVVDLMEVEDKPATPTPLASAATRQWDTFEQARARLLFKVTDDRVLAAVDRLESVLWDVLRARATYPAGAVPEAIVDRAREAEADFVRVAMPRG